VKTDFNKKLWQSHIDEKNLNYIQSHIEKKISSVCSLSVLIVRHIMIFMNHAFSRNFVIAFEFILNAHLL